MSDDNENTNKQPTLYFYQVTQTRDGKAYENYLGAGSRKESGIGSDIRLNAQTVDGRMTMYTAEERIALLKQRRERSAAERQAEPQKEQEREA
ncbi:MAG: hypothetical protein H6920_09815 [Sphingomonadaceae bacterium]|nr:hypothetical protein [Novosphingobium sp.]MCP5391901.1 hypothetical protein [Sphingomonadaceae bacterium]